jgi:3-hydroxyisobutyrate dehydrogenase
MSDPTRALAPGDTIGFIGLGRMGQPMVARLEAAGYQVRAYDVSDTARTAVANERPSVVVVSDLSEVADGASAVILMLPDSKVVTKVVRQSGLLAAMADGSLLLDMSSSEPLVTRELAGPVAAQGLTLIDAPVSGGVRGAQQGNLTIMVGGDAAAVDRARPVLATMGSRVLHVGDTGAGHAVKALNNLLSATNLLIASEAMTAAADFGLDVATVVDAINTSSGRSGATLDKWPDFILPGTFASGFGVGLLLKDIRIALGLAESTSSPSRLTALSVGMWGEAAAALPSDADHTEIARWLDPSRTVR